MKSNQKLTERKTKIEPEKAAGERSSLAGAKITVVGRKEGRRRDARRSLEEESRAGGRDDTFAVKVSRSKSNFEKSMKQPILVNSFKTTPYW